MSNFVVVEEVDGVLARGANIIGAYDGLALEPISET
jgi:hypothetical protein